MPQIPPEMPPADHGDAYLALASALGGALVTGLLGFLQQRAQNTKEMERLRQQLTHERSLEDRNHMRATLDQAADRFDTALDTFHDLVGALRSESSEDTVTEIRVKLLEEIQLCKMTARRLDIHVGYASEVTQNYRKAVEAVDAGTDALGPAPPLTPEIDAAYQEHSKASAVAWANFTHAAQKKVGVAVE